MPGESPSTSGLQKSSAGSTPEPKPKYNLIQGNLPPQAKKKKGQVKVPRSLSVLAKIQSFDMPKGSFGGYPCDVCKGEAMIKFSIAGSNGHIHAACTGGCVSFMQ